MLGLCGWVRDSPERDVADGGKETPQAPSTSCPPQCDRSEERKAARASSRCRTPPCRAGCNSHPPPVSQYCDVTQAAELRRGGGGRAKSGPHLPSRHASFRAPRPRAHGPSARARLLCHGPTCAGVRVLRPAGEFARLGAGRAVGVLGRARRRDQTAQSRGASEAALRLVSRLATAYATADCRRSAKRLPASIASAALTKISSASLA